MIIARTRVKKQWKNDKMHKIHKISRKIWKDNQWTSGERICIIKTTQGGNVIVPTGKAEKKRQALRYFYRKS